MEGKGVKALFVILGLVILMFGGCSMVEAIGSSVDCCHQCFRNCYNFWTGFLNEICLTDCYKTCPQPCIDKFSKGMSVFFPLLTNTLVYLDPDYGELVV